MSRCVKDRVFERSVRIYVNRGKDTTTMTKSNGNAWLRHALPPRILVGRRRCGFFLFNPVIDVMLIGVRDPSALGDP
jgi:hypothetical protein